MKFVISGISICIVLLLVVLLINRQGNIESAPNDPMLATKADRPGRVAPDAATVNNQYIRDNWPIGTPISESAKDFDQAQTTEAKLLVLGKLEATDPDSLAKALRRALLHSDEELRRQSVLMTQSLYPLPEEAIEILSAASFDEYQEVRSHALEMIHEQKPEVKLGVLSNTLNSPFLDVQKTTVLELGRLGTKPALEVLFQGLDHEDSAYVEIVNGELEHLIGKRFSSSQEATEWWLRESEKFNDSLLRLVD